MIFGEPWTMIIMVAIVTIGGARLTHMAIRRFGLPPKLSRRERL